MVSRLCLAALLVLPSVLAWGNLGHRTVAYLAEKQFTNDTAAMVAEILGTTADWDISDAAIWPDGPVKRERPWTAKWHFINANDDAPRACSVNYQRDCQLNGDYGCIVSALSDMNELLVYPGADAQAQKEALMFLIHLMGDVHQPLHAEALGRGGNDILVCFDGKCGAKINLHYVWDWLIPFKMRGLVPTDAGTDREKKAAAAWASELDARQQNRTIWRGECNKLYDMPNCALGWAAESNALVCDFVLAPGLEWIEGHDLAGDYYIGAKLVTELMTRKAGTRLAGWLNTLCAARAQSGRFADFIPAAAGPAQTVLEL